MNRRRGASQLTRLVWETGNRMGEALCDDRPLTFDDLVADFDRGFKPKSEFRVGSEHEKFVFRIPGHGTVPYGGDAASTPC